MRSDDSLDMTEQAENLPVLSVRAISNDSLGAMALVAQAVANGAPVETMRALVDLRNQMEDMLTQVFLNNGCCNNRIAILNKDTFLARCRGPVKNRPSQFLLSCICGM